MENIFSFLYNEAIAYVIKPGINVYYYVVETKSDPRTQDWYLIGSPVPLLVVVAIYIQFCVWIGPWFMKNRQPFELKFILIMYNIVQVLLSVFMVCENIRSGWLINYSFACLPIDYSDNPKALRMASVIWWYFIAKLTELLDTVFFVLRKKNNQISFLHLYHHSIMPICGWLAAKFFPGGHGSLLGFINSFVHVIMYVYYLGGCMGPKFQKYLWWKKHVTELQIIQFCILLVHNTQALFRQCEYPKLINMWLILQAVLFLHLFGQFYVQSYDKQKKMALTENNVPKLKEKN